MRRLLPFVAALVLAPSAAAGPLLGVVGDADRFQRLTGQRSDVGLVFFGWGKGLTWGRSFDSWFERLGDVPAISFGTNDRNGRQAITPRGIARGKGDRYLRKMNRAINDWGGPVYIRPLAEMNGHWNLYCAYNANGTLRGPSHSTNAFRKAFRRMYLILHGGPKDVINRKLARWSMPRISADLPANPVPTLKIIWNPQGFGAPNLHGNRAAAYYPGKAFVDVVGNDLYDIRYRAAWEANRELYKAYPGKPYAIGEWGLWGIDDAPFVRKMARFVRNHRRTELVVYFRSRRGDTFDLASKPASLEAYRNRIVPLGG